MPSLFANLIWISPLWAWAAIGATALPVAVHLLSRRRYRPVVLPTARFVAQAASEAAAIDRPRHWFLLLIRVLALLLVIAAFMQPIWQPRTAVALSPDEGRLRVILIDTSASMQRLHSGVSAFDQALNRADQLLADLEPGRDRAMVYLIDDHVRAILPEPTARLSVLREELKAQRPTWSADEVSLLSATVQDFEQQWGEAEFIWLTDGQSVDRLDPAALPQPLQVEMAGKAVENTSVRWADVRPYPQVTGQPFVASVRVVHHGQETRGLSLSAAFDKQRITREIRLAPGADQMVSFEFDPSGASAGWLTVEFEQSDAFPADDRTGFFINKVEAQSVILVAPETDRALRSRLRQMLQPGTNPAHSERSSFRVNYASPSNLSAVAAESAASATLVFANLRSPLTSETIQAINQHLERGGGVVYFADSPAAYQVLEKLPSPVRLDSSYGTDLRSTLGFGQLELPEIRVFEGSSRELLAGINWPGVAPATALESGQVILRSSDGRPIVARQMSGRGHFYLINADPSANDFLLTIDPGFVILFNELVRLAAPGEQPPMPLRPGESLPESDGLEPSFWQVEQATEPGPITQVQSGEETAGRWVEIDPKESDLFGETQSLTLDPVANGRSDAVTRSVRQGREQSSIQLWPYFLLASLLLLSAEAGFLIAHRRGAVNG